MLFVCNIFIAEDSCLKVLEISRFQMDSAVRQQCSVVEQTPFGSSVKPAHLGLCMRNTDFIVSGSEMVVIFLQKCLIAT